MNHVIQWLDDPSEVSRPEHAAESVPSAADDAIRARVIRHWIPPYVCWFLDVSNSSSENRIREERLIICYLTFHHV